MLKKSIHFFLLLAMLAGLFSLNPASPARAATLTVDNLTDGNDGSCVDGDCSLREAIAAANDTDTITFSVTGTIILTSALTVDKSLTITGPGSSQLTLDGNNQYQIFTLANEFPTNTITISGMTMTKGYADPSVTCGGGAIRSWAFLTMNDVVITDNHAPANIGSCQYPRGGGVLFFDGVGSLTLTNSTVSNNSTAWGGGGIQFNSTTGNLSLDNVIVENNQSTESDGGGVLIANALATVNISNSTITNNDAIGSGAEGGGLYIYPTSFTPIVTITNSTISLNSAPDGGGIYMFGTTVNITSSTIADNSATNDGGGIFNYNGTINIDSSTVEGNSVTGSTTSYGGGIFNLGNADTSSMTIVNSTLTGNSSTLGQGGAIFNQASGGTVNDIATVDIYNTTVVGNSANGNFGGGGLVASTAGGSEVSTINLFNSIVYGNTLTTGMNGENCSTVNDSTIAANNHNLFQILANDCNPGVNDVTSGSETSAIVNALASNSGVTQTMSLPSGSPAIEAGNNTICSAPPVNNESQNGVTRPSGTNCDIGAYEVSAAPTSATFGDVPMSHPYWLDIEILYANGLTAGCSASPLLFCPDTTMDRAQSSVFMLRGNLGVGYVPPNPPFGSTFGDNWGPGPWAQKWAQGMLQEGLTAGCSSAPLLYCPWDAMPRLQAAVFGMRLQEGNAYVPPAATGTVFADITDPNLWYAKWAEAAYANGLLPACGSSGGKPLFCPNDLVSRGLGAYMIVRAKNLSMP